jgi:hypothetical protein
MYELWDQLSNALPAITNADLRAVRLSSNRLSFTQRMQITGAVMQAGLPNRLAEIVIGCISFVFCMSATSPPENWADYPVDEGLNCYVSLVGRPDLVR